MLNGMVSAPGYAAAAFGWPQLITCTNLIQTIAIIPLIVGLVLWLGGVGTGVVWIALNSTYLLFTVPRFDRDPVAGLVSRPGRGTDLTGLRNRAAERQPREREAQVWARQPPPARYAFPCS